MNDDRLKALETACRATAAGGKIELYASDVLDLVRELRELRKHACNLSAHHETIARLHTLLASLSAYAEGPLEDDSEGSGRIAIQDPGR
jgi:hypothetical protein